MVDNYRDFIENFRDIYFKEIKPFIQKGEYETAKSMLKNIELTLQSGPNEIFNITEIVASVHSGLNLLGTIGVLYEKLDQEEFNPKKDLRPLEAYLAQTNLPTKEEVSKKADFSE